MGWGSDYQPTATGNPTSGHSWAASSTYGGYYPWTAADDSISTSWSSNLVPTGWWEYTPDVSVVFSKASIRAQNTSGVNAPKDFTIEGWNGTSWVVLLTVTGETGWGASTRREFVWTNSVAYSKYKIDVTAVNGGSAVGIAEVEWFILEADERSLIVVTT